MGLDEYAEITQPYADNSAVMKPNYVNIHDYVNAEAKITIDNRNSQNEGIQTVETGPSSTYTPLQWN